MERELVFVHGRSQQGRDPDGAKKEWVDALRAGLKKSGLELPIDEKLIRFPFYGDTLMDLVEERSDVAEIVVRGFEKDAQARAFLEQVLREVKEKEQFTDADIRDAVDAEAVTVAARGIQNSRLVLGMLRLINDRLPGVGGTALAAATYDVYQYVNNIGISRLIDTGVSKAITPGRESVVVAHSLGTVVAYNLLQAHGSSKDWNVTQFITLGSPLGVTAIRSRLSPLSHPKVVSGAWSNAYDPDDIVALRPLQKPWFGIDPPIRNKGDVRNETDNQHGIRGYLGDPEVARWIHEALTEPSSG